jgi:D-alanine transaminase
VPPAGDGAAAGAAEHEWLAADGRPAARERPVWETGRPAPCDAPTLHRARVAVTRFLRDEGYLAIPPVVERRTAARGGRGGAGPGKSDVDAAIRTDGDTAALVVTVKRIAPYPTDIDKWQASCITLPDLRWARRDIKSVNLLPNCLARQAAREKGAIEAILYDEATGIVNEGAATTFWIFDAKGAIRTRHLDHVILPGCTRGALMAELRAAGIAWDETPFTLDDMKQAREAFITSATSFVRPITKIDGAPVGDGKVGPVVRRLFDIFARHVKGDLRNAA